MSGLENLLRDVLGELADDAPEPAPDRAERALRASRARRRTAVLVAAAAVVLLVGALVVPVLVRSGPAPTGGPAPTETPDPGSGPPPPEKLPALPVVTGLRLTPAATTGPSQLTSYALRDGGTAVRTPGSITFRRLPWTDAAVSPTGRIAVVDSTDARPGFRIGIIDSLGAGTIRWFDAGVPVVGPVWSPDGRQVLVTMLERRSADAGHRLGANIFDPERWQLRQVAFPDDPTDLGSYGLRLGWDPDGDRMIGSVELPDDHTGVPRFGLRWWDLVGEPDRLLATPGPLTMSGSQLLSPSGASAVVATGRRSITVVSTATGKLVAAPPSAGQSVYGWADEDHLVVEGAAGLVLLGLDGTTRPYATRVGDAALVERIDITPVG